MTLYTCNPVEDARWAELVAKHVDSSIFHTPGWLDALRRTYHYDPVVYTTCPPDAPLTSGVVFCRVSSWITGRRIVSLPFSDHCEPLFGPGEDPGALFSRLCASAHGMWKYVEVRPVSPAPYDRAGFTSAASYRFHTLDLGPSVDRLFAQTHHSTIQRNVRRAERERLTYESGRSDALLHAFYRLTLLTRRRHGLPPQPLEWFRNILACLGPQATIRVAAKAGRPVGSILTLAHKDTIVYKYGCSDARFHNVGVMPFLFWKAIEESKADGFQHFDLGRSDLENEGLIAFKERLGGVPSKLTYFRCSAGRQVSRFRPHVPIVRAFCRHAPDRVLMAAGRFLYHHLG